MKRKMARLALVLVVVIAAGYGLWRVFGSSSSESATDIISSGFIEAKDVAIALETGGRIVDITVDEGDSVEAGLPLVSLDSSLLQAQRQQAEANVRLAEANLAQAMVARDGAKRAWENALDVQKDPLELEAKIIAAKGQLEIAEFNLLQATDNYKKITYPYTYATFAFDVPTALGDIADAQRQVAAAQKLLTAEPGSSQYQSGLNQLQEAQETLTKARERLARGQGEDVFAGQLLAAKDFWTLRAAQLQVEEAKSSLDTADKTLQNLVDIRNNPQEINTAVDAAHTAYQTAITAVTVAERNVEQAKAALGISQVQLSKLSLTSPVSGVVATRYAEAGEIAQPGAPVMTITQLAEVTLTTYVPERKTGLVKLGQKALVSVDSYPGESFPGEVVYISPRALFTPKNIQLKEEREKMVFAVKIRLANAEQKLKPGMPADARLLINTSG